MKINLNSVELIIYDFDGVMTDNKAIIFSDGTEGVIVNRSDGLAVKHIKAMGIPQVIISTEQNEVVLARAEKLGIPAVNNVWDKKERVLKYCAENKHALKNTIYLGNDLNDLEAMKIVGIPMCPLDAYPEIKKISKHRFAKKGGGGVIRELADLLRKNKIKKSVGRKR
jgi:3-deoxy-D-manno-octulosonate 8-phosphate phosphatase (KDO 8-P phosphatase)